MRASECRAIFEEVYRGLRRGSTPPIEVSFYPYTHLDHTIRLRKGRLLVRLSDVLVDAPAEVIEALAHLLLGKILRRRIDARHASLYRCYTQRPDVVADTAHTRALRARPSPGVSKCRHNDLGALFARLNDRYFDGRLQGVRLLWTHARAWTRLGYYRQAVHTIVISKALDDPRVPAYVLEFILYHEMLHAAIPPVLRHGRRYDHTREFKAAERRFERFDEATQYLRRWPSQLRMGAQRQAAGGAPRQRRLFD